MTRLFVLLAVPEYVAADPRISPGPGHTAAPPMVMEHLGMPVDPAWGWEDEPFAL